ncbi:uncharacterized protein AMSG_11788 [Thecamonas trahens ATCC 50062]|uniref:Rhamnogalacturonase A/B/Epimerase-like pectate lyase domain-containing protein n=1 Tax=Thecamonas trahens ATCC 50062 TaxID=461836 RepID=A0A0L0D667_THETB|nr:hypothetical protein AMSG_11788 [Thecamonas trahens ATCC 50062]KNC47685.1 hypothetical protein AMSG_11788 [Thecamonas trahens ATCC 50062]|eukprot:XP_013759365.1 hypothetical protein AMSG_11788 [Thecamonas trahens ATCC 50062]
MPGTTRIAVRTILPLLLVLVSLSVGMSSARRVQGRLLARALEARHDRWHGSSVGPARRGTTEQNSVTNVLDHGARAGDGSFDNAVPFQAALNAALAAGGGIVWVPAGQFTFHSSITVPVGVSLEGTYRAPPAHNVGEGGLPPTHGSVLLVVGGRGEASGTPFATLKQDATLRGVVLYYPDQDPKAAPTPYPFTLSLSVNSAVIDVEGVNPYQFISAVGAARHYIARVYGQPSLIGIYVDDVTDIGRMIDIHFNPWYSQHPEYMRLQLTRGRAFVLGRSDWQFCTRLFAFAYSVGFHFIETAAGATNGILEESGADMAYNASVLIEQVDVWGLQIAACEFTSFASPQWANVSVTSIELVVAPTNSGTVTVSNTAFWGPSYSIASVAGSGMVSFSGCTFTQWDVHHKGLPAVTIAGATAVSITDSLFLQNNCISGTCFSQIDRTRESSGAIMVANNIFTGAIHNLVALCSKRSSDSCLVINNVVRL